ncbi:MAG TPA: hypothetical protein PKD83_13220 [Ignavibacteria bacterium]|nr:hypothetical protein [Ignavibacteria bacterium]
MKHIFRVFSPLIAILIFVNLYFANTDDLKPIDNYPIWMMDSAGNKTDQTSGLSFTGELNGKKMFISCDDIGKINRISVDESKNPPVFEFTEIKFSAKVNTLFDKFKKKDMEDIYFDSLNNKIYLAIEGHELSSLDPEIYRKKEGIYELTFNNDILSFDSILTIKRLKFPEVVYRFTHDNIGFEGFSATKNYMFIGLENFQFNGAGFSDSTIIYIFNRKTGLVKSIGTSELKISSVCGLKATDDYNLYGIDRNRKNMFYINFDENFDVNEVKIKRLELSIPMHPDINNIIGVAPESITFDYNNNIYVSIDPWKDIYKPDITQKRKLSNEELDKFYNFVPIMYKFKNDFN